MRLTLFGPVVILTRAEDAALLFLAQRNCCKWGFKLARPLIRIWIAPSVKIFCVPGYGLQRPFICQVQLLRSGTYMLGQKRWKRLKHAQRIHTRTYLVVID